MSPLPLGVTASSGTAAAPSYVEVVGGPSPSATTLTGGVYVVKNNAKYATYTLGSDYLRMAWPAWSDSHIYTNNTFDLTGATRYEADVDTLGMNSSYGYFSINYVNTSGTYSNPYSYPRATSRRMYYVNLTNAPGVGQIRFNGGNTFGNVYVYSLRFYFD
jgi:hypothetical protein